MTSSSAPSVSSEIDSSSASSVSAEFTSLSLCEGVGSDSLFSGFSSGSMTSSSAPSVSSETDSSTVTVEYVTILGLDS